MWQVMNVANISQLRPQHTETEEHSLAACTLCTPSWQSEHFLLK